MNVEPGHSTDIGMVDAPLHDPDVPRDGSAVGYDRKTSHSAEEVGAYRPSATTLPAGKGENRMTNESSIDSPRHESGPSPRRAARAAREKAESERSAAQAGQSTAAVASATARAEDAAIQDHSAPARHGSTTHYASAPGKSDAAPDPQPVATAKVSEAEAKVAEAEAAEQIRAQAAAEARAEARADALDAAQRARTQSAQRARTEAIEAQRAAAERVRQTLRANAAPLRDRSRAARSAVSPDSSRDATSASLTGGESRPDAGQPAMKRAQTRRASESPFDQNAKEHQPHYVVEPQSSSRPAQVAPAPAVATTTPTVPAAAKAPTKATPAPKVVTAPTQATPVENVTPPVVKAAEAPAKVTPTVKAVEAPNQAAPAAKLIPASKAAEAPTKATPPVLKSADAPSKTTPAPQSPEVPAKVTPPVAKTAPAPKAAVEAPAKKPAEAKIAPSVAKVNPAPQAAKTPPVVAKTPAPAAAPARPLAPPVIQTPQSTPASASDPVPEAVVPSAPEGATEASPEYEDAELAHAGVPASHAHDSAWDTEHESADSQTHYAPHANWEPAHDQSQGRENLFLMTSGIDRKARKERLRRRNWVITVVLLAFCAVIFGVVIFLQGIVDRLNPQDFDAPGGATVSFEVKSGWGPQTIANELVDKDIVASDKLFLEAVQLVDTDNREIHPGTYELRAEMPALDAATILIGETAAKVSYVAIKENTRMGTVITDIASATGLSEAELGVLVEDPSAFGLTKSVVDLEGYLHPGEYRFPVDADAKTVLKTMVDATLKTLTDAGITDAEQQYRVLKIASILQAEARPDDYATVAGALENRLKAGNTETAGLLQVDSSVIYGLDRYTLHFTPKEKADASNAYNTYVHKGLPPTPIGSPGHGAITAAAHPEANEFYYWVTVNTNTGETKFAKTYAEHQVNQNEFRSWCAANTDVCK